MVEKLRVATIMAALIVSSGCATVSEEDLVAVRTIAENAQAEAEEASRQATAAREMASSAQSTANQALSAANAAQACCNATNEKVDRMFETTLQK